MNSKKLAKDINKSRKFRDTFEEGDVIRWVSGGRFKYAAIKAGGRWWITGVANWYGAKVFSYEEFVEEVLANAETSNIEIAVTWDEVE